MRIIAMARQVVFDERGELGLIFYNGDSLRHARYGRCLPTVRTIVRRSRGQRCRTAKLEDCRGATILRRYLLLGCLLLMVRTTAESACRDCAQPGFGGPLENRFTAYDAIWRGDSSSAAGYPQIFVNTSNLTLFVLFTD